MDINTIRQYIKEGKFDFGRSDEVETKYITTVESILKGWATIEDFIKMKIFSMPISINEQGVCCVVSDISQQFKYSLIPNEYPYNMVKGTLHYVLWSTIPLEEERVNNLLRKELGNYQDIFWFEQSREQKSVKDIWHIHVFVKYDDGYN